MCLICLLLVSLRRTINSALFIAEGGNEACHNCILEDNEVKCWGMNIFGECGYGDTNNRGDEANEMGDTLLEIDLGSNFTPIQIVKGGYHTCALSANAVKCFGLNDYGQLGYGDTNNRGDGSSEMGDALPEIDFGISFIPMKITAGDYHNCVLSTGNKVKCFGRGELGQNGYGDRNHRGDETNEMGDNLLHVDLGSNFVPTEIKAGGHHTCALSRTNKVKCWGWGVFYGVLGYEDRNSRGDEANQMGDRLPEIDLGSSFEVIQLATGYSHTCALSTQNKVKCWGKNTYGALGYGDMNDRGDVANTMGDNLLEVDLGSGFMTIQITAGADHMCALSTDNKVKAWGRNRYGQLGYGDVNNRGVGTNEMGDALPEIDLGSSFTPVQVAAGMHHMCAVSTADKVKCFGLNDDGQLGSGDTNNRGDDANEMGDRLPEIDLGSTVHTTTLPTANPLAPTRMPTSTPTDKPTHIPSHSPIRAPTASPATPVPSNYPIRASTASPATHVPSHNPIDSPTSSTASPATPVPSNSPSGSPTTAVPSNDPIDSPTSSILLAYTPSSNPSRKEWHGEVFATEGASTSPSKIDIYPNTSSDDISQTIEVLLVVGCIVLCAIAAIGLYLTLKMRKNSLETKRTCNSDEVSHEEEMTIMGTDGAKSQCIVRRDSSECLDEQVLASVNAMTNVGPQLQMGDLEGEGGADEDDELYESINTHQPSVRTPESPEGDVCKGCGLRKAGKVFEMNGLFYCKDCWKSYGFYDNDIDPSRYEKQGDTKGKTQAVDELEGEQMEDIRL